MDEKTAAERLASVRRRMRQAAHRAGRCPDSVRLVAVGKTFPVSALKAMVQAGEFRLGENRVQEAEEKAASLGPDVEWHLVGHLQSNKAARAAALFHWIHGLDSQRLARRLSRAAMASGRRLKALVQVNLAAEPGKSGVAPLQLPELLAGVRNLEGVEVRGLMVIPPAGQEYARASFRRLGELAHDAMERGLLPQPLELSMGMSADFEIAIEEGATIVRVGSALFGRRSP